jgi:hypothetical protein
MNHLPDLKGQTMNTTRRLAIAGILALAPVAFLYAQTKPASAPAPASTYTDVTYHFSINAPAFSEAKTNATPVIFTGPAANGFAPNTTVMVQPIKITRAAYLASVQNDLKTTLKATINSQKELQISGRDGAIIDYSAAVNGHDMRFLQMYVIAADRVYLVTCTSLAGDFAAHEAAFSAALNSFQVTGQ